ncbi:hypothetical protein SB85_09285 [Xanthomonas sacchari]|nr:hypothetical protein SB85_09285 [Xanthomonas sacchari]
MIWRLGGTVCSVWCEVLDWRPPKADSAPAGRRDPAARRRTASKGHWRAHSTHARGARISFSPRRGRATTARAVPPASPATSRSAAASWLAAFPPRLPAQPHRAHAARRARSPLPCAAAACIAAGLSATAGVAA